jgi:hypothetical protein
VLDALSRREQDTLGEDDKMSRFRRFLEPDYVKNWPALLEEGEVVVATTSVQLLATQFEQDPSRKHPESQALF